MPGITSHNFFSRDAATWPLKKAKEKQRHRERKKIAREAQRKRDAEQSTNPNR